MPKTNQRIKSTKMITLIASISVVVVMALAISAGTLIGANKHLAPKEAFFACESKLPQSTKNDIVKVGDGFDGFYAKIQDAKEYESWDKCISKKLGVGQEEWNNVAMEQTSSQNPTPKELEQIFEDMSNFLIYAFSTNDDEETVMSNLPESISKIGNYNSIKDLPDNFVRDYVYNKQFFKKYDFDEFSLLTNQRPDDYATEIIVYAKDSDNLSVVASTCGAMYNFSKQSSFEMSNSYTLKISQPFFALSDGSASVGSAIMMFDSFSCVHTLLDVPEWSSEDAWAQFIGDGNNTKWSKRWNNYRLEVDLKYEGRGDYKFTETITEI